MSFSSVSFFVFMIAVFLIYWGIPHKFRYLLLIFANLAFCLSFGAKYLPVLMVEVLIAYVAARVIGDSSDVKTIRHKVILTASIVLLVLPLYIFKYFNFSMYAVFKVLSKIAIPINESSIKIIAPIGISFYTFELLSYVIDVYKGKMCAEKNILKLFVYAGFFPNITSGPIERAKKFFDQLNIEKRFDYDKSVYGLRLILLGMLKKICGADVLKQYVDAVFGNIYAYKGATFIVAIVLYAYEIYLDFSGYTDMARGFAAMLGFELTENFKAPYLSNGIKEFFARWHISLSQWLRDYIYIPLGGSRCKKSRKYINLIITFLVSGIWHGASFTFIIWGLLHGIYQCMSDALTSLFKRQNDVNITNNSENCNTEMQNNTIFKMKKYIKIAFTFVLVSFAWMFFRANSLSDAKYIATHMIFGDNFYGQMLQMGFLKTSAYISVVLIIGLTVLYDAISERLVARNSNIIEEFGLLKLPVRWIIYVLAGILVIVLRSHTGASSDFIYFKF